MSQAISQTLGGHDLIRNYNHVAGANGAETIDHVDDDETYARVWVQKKRLLVHWDLLLQVIKYRFISSHDRCEF